MRKGSKAVPMLCLTGDNSQLGNSEERGQCVARELVSGFADVRVSPVVRGVPKERLHVGGGRVRGRGHGVRARIRVREGVKGVGRVFSSWFSS
jgi:hypothetical protein